MPFGLAHRPTCIAFIKEHYEKSDSLLCNLKQNGKSTVLSLKLIAKMALEIKIRLLIMNSAI